MTKRAHEASGLAEFLPFDDVSALNTLSKLVDVRGLLVMGDPAFAVAGVYAAPSYWNSRVTTAGLLFIWMEPKERKDGRGEAFLSAIEGRAREMGASVLMVNSLDTSKPEAMGRLYRKSGFTGTERYYMKGL